MRIGCMVFFWGEGSRVHLQQWGTAVNLASHDSVSAEKPPKSHLHYALHSKIHFAKPTLLLWGRKLLEFARRDKIKTIILCSASQRAFDETPSEGYMETNNWPWEKGEGPLPIIFSVSNRKTKGAMIWYFLWWNISAEGWHREVWIFGAYETQHIYAEKGLTLLVCLTFVSNHMLHLWAIVCFTVYGRCHI